MKNFRQFNEDASDKLSGMDDKQVADLKKNNPGAAAKIDQLRNKKKAASAPSSDKKELPTSAITKPGGALMKKPSGSDLARQKARQSQMGKFSQGIKNSPSSLAKKAGSGLAKSNTIKNVNVKDVTPKKVEDEKQAIGNRSKPVSDMADKQRERILKDKAMVAGKKKKNKNRIGDAIKGIGSLAAKGLKKASGGASSGLGSEGGDSLEALQKNSY